MANSNVGACGQVCYMLRFLYAITLSLSTITAFVHPALQPQFVQKTSLLMFLIGHQDKIKEGILSSLFTGVSNFYNL